MCHNSGVQSTQIERFVEHGMPQRAVKTVSYTIRKRAEEHQKSCEAESRDPSAEETRDRTLATVGQKAPATRTPTTKTTTTTTKTAPTKVPMVCPFFAKHKQTVEDITDIGSEKSFSSLVSQAEDVQMDALAISTQWTKKLVERLCRTVENLQSSKFYTLLTKTTQPAHFIAICILSFVLLAVWPQIVERTSDSTTSKTERQQSDRHHLAVIAYLGAFATHFGAQIWMTFVSGLSLYFALPRHTFGQCQQILFPKYYALNSVLSISMLILFVKCFMENWSFSGCIQLASLALTAVIEVTVRLYLAPPLLRLMHEKYRIEDTIGSGQEVGSLVQGDLVSCPHYQRIHKMFRRIHMTVAIGNMVVLLCTCLHLYYLASRISLK